MRDGSATAMAIAMNTTSSKAPTAALAKPVGSPLTPTTSMMAVSTEQATILMIDPVLLNGFRADRVDRGRAIGSVWSKSAMASNWVGELRSASGSPDGRCALMEPRRVVKIPSRVKACRFRFFLLR